MKIFLRVDWNCPKGSYTKVRETEHFLLRLKHHTVCIGTHYNGNTKELLKHTTLPIQHHDTLFTSQIVKPGLHLLPNLRNDKGEQKNSIFFAQQLTQDCDLYINNAWGTVHRKHASIDKASKECKAMMGPLVQAELAKCKHFKKALYIVGGAKLDKLNIILDLLKQGNKVAIIGALSIPFLQLKGLCMGAPKKLELCEEILKYNPILPIDYVVSDKPESEGMIVHDHEIPHGTFVYDIGPETIEMLGHHIKLNKKVVWNGPAGYTPSPIYKRGTIELARKIIESNVQSYICGGDTMAELEQYAWANFTHTTTAGGAALSVLSKEKMEWLNRLQPFVPELVFEK